MNKKESIKVLFISALIGVFLGATIGISGLSATYNEDFKSWLFLVILFIPSYFIGVIIHESGHLVCGLLSGYKFISFRILSFLLTKENNKFLIKKYNIPGTIGQCLMSPPDLKDEKIPCVFYLLGGSLFNLLTALICIIIVFNLNSNILKTIFIALYAVSMYSGLTNIIPLETNEVFNDGKNIQELMHNKSLSKYLYKQLKIAEYEDKGYRIKDIPEELFVVNDEDPKDSTFVSSALTFLEARKVDEHKFDEALEIITKLKNEYKLLGIHKKLIEFDRIYIELINNHDSDISILDNKEYKMYLKLNNPSILRTLYAIEKIKNHDEEKANQYLLEFNKVKDNYPMKGDIESEEELINIVI